MVATRGRSFKRPWRRSCLSSKLKSSSAPIGRKDSWCFHAVGSSNAPLRGSTAAEGLPGIGRTSIATRWRSCGLPQSASCSENFVIPPDVSGQTLRDIRKVKLAVEGRDVVAVGAVFRQQLIAENPLHDRVAIVEPIDVGDIEAPVDVILLRGIGQALDAENELIELDPIRMDGIAGRRERLGRRA